MLVFRCQIGTNERRCWEFYNFARHLEGTRTSFTIFHPFFLCLTVSDFLVGVICQPFYVAFQIVELADSLSAYCTLRLIHNISSWTTSGVSLSILSTVSIDRLLALTLHLRYSAVITVARVIKTAVWLWTVATAVATLKFWMNKWIIIPALMLVLVFLITTLSTLKIFQIVRRHQRQISQSVQSNTINNSCSNVENLL